MRLFLLLVLLVHLLPFSSCKKYKPADAAFFIKAGKVSVATGKDEGSGSHKITDLWLYVNGKFQGAYPVGNIMPIVSKGNSVKINVFAGIKNNGISDTRTSWLFYSNLQIDTLVENGKTIERPFTFTYNPTTTFAFHEDFEQRGVQFEKSAVSGTSLTTASAGDSFEGKSALLELDPDYNYAQVQSTGDGIELPVGSSNVYLELNYKCNQIFSVGLMANDGTLKPALIINPQENWNKIYVQLSTAIGSQPSSLKHRVYFQMPKLDESSNPKLFLDNVKIVYL